MTESAGADAPATDIAQAEYWRGLERSYGDAGIHATFGLALQVVGRGKVVIHLGNAMPGTNRSGNLAGGLLAAMIDSAVVQAIRTVLAPGDHTSTVEMKVNFLRPAPAESTVAAHGTLLDVGGRLGVGLAEIRDQDDQLLCAGMATVRIHRATDRP